MSHSDSADKVFLKMAKIFAAHKYPRINFLSLVNHIALSRVINGIAQGKYEKAAMLVPETFGIKKTAVCRRFMGVTAKKLREYMERDLSQRDIVAIFIDGKQFSRMKLSLGWASQRMGIMSF